MNILFVCSRNKWRSPTAEAIYKNTPGVQVRSAGTAASARVKVTEKLVLWADMVFAMEKEHRQRLQERFAETVKDKTIVVLDIPDEYGFMDVELVEMIRAGVREFIEG